MSYLRLDVPLLPSVFTIKQEAEKVADGPFSNLLSEFVYKRTYSRWDYDLGRREEWDETVARYIAFIAAERKMPAHVLSDIHQAVLDMRVLPSMRALWSAGEAASRDNTCMYNCFGGNEKFVTPEGILTLKEAVGRDVTVRTIDGQWRPATVQSFGRQQLQTVTFDHWNGGKHGNERHTVRVTRDHRWILQDGTETTKLEVGDKLAAPALALDENQIDDDAVRHGFVFGDGAINRDGDREYAQVRLCGKKARLLNTVFAGFESSNPPSYNGDPMVYCGKENVHWKRLPETTNPGYVAGFIKGLFLADGWGTTTSGNIAIGTQDEAVVAWLRENAALAGYKVLSHQVYNGATNYGERNAPLNKVILGTGNAAVFRVANITLDLEDEVFCVVEPETKTFMLANGQVTGNCAFVPLDSLPSFVELLYILMMGTGIGYSVESQFVDNLPPVASLSGTVVQHEVADSTDGWADAFFFGLQQWFQGHKVSFDFSLVRPAGAPLRVKGGRASGPEPLQRLFAFCEETLLAAAGRQIRPIEAHDIACMIGEIVMAGGVRRAALISVSDIDDMEMRHAKDFSLGEFPKLRYMANNSAFYQERPDRETFDKEWSALVQSGSGERGFLIDNFWRRANRPKGECRINPCISARSWVPTVDGPRRVSQIIGQPFEAIVDGKVYSSSERGFWLTGEKELFRLDTTEGYSLELTGNHKVCRVMQSQRAQKFEWVEASALEPGDLIRLNNHRDVVLDGDVSARARGWLLGSLLGEGTFTVEASESKSDHGHLRFWGDDAEHMATEAFGLFKQAGVQVRSDARPNRNHTNGFWQVSSTALANMAESYGMVPAAKTITEKMEQESIDFAAGFLSGLFDADGSVQGNQDKGISVRLAQSNLNTLEAAQRMLLRLGVVSSIYKNRREAGYRNLPDGKGGLAPYWCQTQHELVIANDNLFQFEALVGFTEPAKAALLGDLLGHYRRQPNRERFVVRVESLTSMGVEEVYDCTIPDLGAFDANGFYVHNCGEISLRFRRSVDPWTGEGGCGQFCNLSAAVMRADDTVESFAEKVRIAAWIGAIQATFTHFPYLRPGWQEVCAEDRLLGVDITGQCDNPKLSRNMEAMTYFNKIARETAAEATAYLGVNMPVAITCGKPSGNSSQLLDCASGFHPRFASFYIRRVRVASTDPLFKLIRDAGVPVSPDNQFEGWAEEDVPTWVAEFPVKSPEGAVLRDAETAIDQCNRYLEVVNSWLSNRGHNQSATIYVHPEEWAGVGEWLWDHFEEVTGLSFLPYDGGNYKLAPYEEITSDQYDTILAAMPDVDFSLLTRYEQEDRGEGAAELACMGGSCEIDFSTDAVEAGKVAEAK